MILNPTELETILPRRKKSGKEVDDYWRIWVQVFPLAMRSRKGNWVEKANKVKKHLRDAKYKKLRTTRTADAIMENEFKAFSDQYNVEMPNLDGLRDEGVNLRWSKVLQLIYDQNNNELEIQQLKLAEFYEDLHDKISMRSEKSSEVLLKSLDTHIPFSQETEKLVEYESAKHKAGGRILRLLCTVDFLIHDPVIARASEQIKIRHFILDSLPTEHNVEDDKTPERRFLQLLKERIKAGKFAFVWKVLKQKDTVKNWINGRNHPSQERLLELLIDITNKVKEQIQTSPDIVEWEDLSPEEIQEGAEEIAVEEFILLSKFLELTILLDAIFKQLEIYTGSRHNASELLNQQVQFSLQKCNGSNA